MDTMHYKYFHEGLEITNVPYKDGQLDIVTKLVLSSIIKSMKRTCVCKCDYDIASKIARF